MKELVNCIFQRFELDKDRFEKLMKDEESDIHRVGGKLKKGLSEKGYIILECGNHFGNLPASIIVGGEFGGMQNVKEDFYTLASELGVPYTSADFYTVVHRTNKTESDIPEKERFEYGY